MNSSVIEESTVRRPLDARRTVPWIIFVVFFAVLNETVFNVSTPAIAAQFSLSASGVSWVMTTFIVFFGVGSVIYGKLSDMFSLKRLIVIGIIVYSSGSLLGLVFASLYPVVIAARAVQGAGASAIPALITVLVARYFPVSERGRIFGYITSTVAFAIGVGPVIGGFVSGTLHWSMLFAVPLFTLISIPFFRGALPAEEKRSGGIDLLGAVLVAFGIGSLILYLSFASWYYLAAGLLLLAGFVVDITKSKNPFIAPHLFRNSTFRKRIYVGFIVSSAVTGVLFVIPLMLSAVGSLTTSQIGLVLFPGAISAVVFGTIGGNLADKRGNTFVVTIGLALLAASFLVISLVVGLSPWFLAAALLPTYVGFSLAQTALVNSVSQTLSVEETGIGMGLFNLVSFISAAVGTALVGRYLAAGGFRAVHLPGVSDTRAFAYSNLLVVFAVIVVFAAALYYASLRGAAAQAAAGEPDGLLE
ncbi:MAG TPA: MFS transporter [Spirochaetia bacterium]|nr:MFS transporter [Spirochaetia bacterium]